MYSKENQSHLLQLSNKLISSLNKEIENPIEKIGILKQVINFHDWSYYINSNQLITDFDYDQLFALLKKIERENPTLITPDSPTQRVAKGLNERFDSVTHLTPMLSLENSYNADDLKDFDRRVKENLPENYITEYTVEPKYDGSSIALVYENDLLIRAATRGNGTEGEEITNNAKVIKSIPLKANFSKYGIYKVELRGEVIIHLEAFEKLNKNRIAKNKILKEQGKKELELFKHARNTAAGALRLKDPSSVAERKLEAAIYQIGYAEDKEGNLIESKLLQSHYKNMELLQSLGFKTPTYEKDKFNDIEKVVKFCNHWESRRDSYPYEIDGMVIKVDNHHAQKLIGITAHHPKWAIAFKFKAKQATTKLKSIDFQIGRTGAITPVAKLEPVILTGVEISSVSLHNEDFINDKNIMLGDTVIVERAGDVIPYIVGPIKELRNGEENPIVFPNQCPSCNHDLFKPEEESVWRCINASCPAQREERLIHYVSKGAMNIEGLGKDILKRFIRKGLISDLTDIYKLDFNQILQLEGWKEKSVENLKSSIEASKSNPLWRLIVGLGIRHVGGTTAKMLSKKVKGLLDFSEWSLEDLIELEDIGPKVAESLIEFFSDESNILLIKKLKEFGLNIESVEEEKKSDILSGKTFLFTGTLAQFSRDKAKLMVEEHGGKNLSGVSAKLDYLIAGEKAGSKLAKAKKIETIKIISEDEFLSLISE